MLDQHDRDGIGAGEMLGPARGIAAIALPAAFGERGRAAANRAETVAGVPTDQRASRAICGDLFTRQGCSGLPQTGAGRRDIGLGRNSSKAGAVFQKPEEHQLASVIHFGQRAPVQRSIIADHRVEAVQTQ